MAIGSWMGGSIQGTPTSLGGLPMDSRRSHFILSLFLLLAVALSPSCGSSEKSEIDVSGNFVVRFDSTEGGCWNLVATDNTIYGPTNLDNAYRIDGLRVTASLQLSPHSIIICNGAPVTIVEIAPAP
jgi:hypothetical protein